MAELAAEQLREETRLKAEPAPEYAVQSAIKNGCDHNGQTKYLRRREVDNNSLVYKIGCYNDDRYIVCMNNGFCFQYSGGAPTN